jgi:hypothetical protein
VAERNNLPGGSAGSGLDTSGTQPNSGGGAIATPGGGAATPPPEAAEGWVQDAPGSQVWKHPDLDYAWDGEAQAYRWTDAQGVAHSSHGALTAEEEASIKTRQKN